MILTLNSPRPSKARKPRTRGDDPPAMLKYCLGLGVNPARAGMIPGLTTGTLASYSKPRTRGDDPKDASQQRKALS